MRLTAPSVYVWMSRPAVTYNILASPLTLSCFAVSNCLHACLDFIQLFHWNTPPPPTHTNIYRHILKNMCYLHEISHSCCLCCHPNSVYLLATISSFIPFTDCYYDHSLINYNNYWFFWYIGYWFTQQIPISQSISDAINCCSMSVVTAAWTSLN